MNHNHQIEAELKRTRIELQQRLRIQRVLEQILRCHVRVYERLGNSITDTFFMLDMEQRHTIVMGKWLEKYGLKSEQFLGKRSEEILGEEAAAIHTHANQKALNGEVVAYEWSPPWENELHYYQTIVSPLKDKDEQDTIGIVGIGRDITNYKLIEEALYFTNQQIDDVQEDVFHDRLARFLTEKLQVNHVLIGRLTADRNHVTTTTNWANGQKTKNITYTLSGTPCNNVMERGFCCYNEQLIARFPEDAMLVEANIQAYAGQPLRDGEGKPFGIIAVLSEQPFKDVLLIRSVLQIIAMRAAYESEQQQMRWRMNLQKQLALQLGALTDVKEMAQVILTKLLKMEEVDAGGIYVPDYQRGGMVTVYTQNLPETYEQQLAFVPFGSSWLKIIKNGRHIYRNNTINEHECDQLRETAGIQCSANFPIFYEQKLVAILSLVSYHFDEFSLATKQLLEAVSSQLGGALARAAAEQELRKSEERQRSLFESLGEGIVVHDRSGVIISCNQSAEEILGLTKDQMNGRMSIDPRWQAIHEDGSPFSGETHPAMVTLHTGEPQRNVVMGVYKPNGQLTWITINSQPIYENGTAELTGVIASFVDITERVVAEQKVRQNEEHYRQMFEANQAIKLIIKPTNGQIIEANSAAVNFYGYSREELLQTSIFNINIDNKRLVKQRVEQTLKQKHLNINVKHRLASGEIRDVEIFSAPINMDNETFLYAIIHDVTRRREAETQLNKLRQAIEQSSSSIVITDTDGRIEYVNPSFTKSTGYTFAEAIGQNPNILKSGYTSQEEYEQLWQKIQEGQVWEGEFYNQRKDGSLYWESASISPIKNEAGTIINFLAIKDDITEKKRVAEALQHRNRELNLLYETNRSLSATLDLDEALAGMLEKTRQSLDVGACIVWLVEDESQNLVCRQAATPNGNLIQGWQIAAGDGIVGRTAANNQSYIVSDITKNQDCIIPISDYINVDIHAVLSVPLHVHHKAIGVFQLIDSEVGRFNQRDLELVQAIASSIANTIENTRLHENLRQQLTLLQKTQERLIQSEKLAAIGELVAGVAHELNNPLTAIVLYSQLLERRGLDELAKRDLNKILTQAKRASNVVKRLLDFARQQPPEQKPVQINDIISSTVELLSYELRNSHMNIQLDLEANLPIIMADPHQLQQVIVNLIQNAIHATAEVQNGSCLIVTTHFGPSFYNKHNPKEESILRIAIRDNGMGIPEAVQSRVFDPFFTTKAVGIGTGLGLSVCHGIISEHKGHIWFETTLGKGTTFYIELPVRIPEEMNSQDLLVEEDTAVVPKQAAAQILVIDDEPTVRHIMNRILSKEGYAVDSVESGFEGLDRLREKSYDLILCDLRMPKMSGIEFYEQAIQTHPNISRKVLFTTGDTVNISTRHFFNSIEATYLSKPFEIHTLISTVQEKLNILTNQTSSST